MFRVGHGVDVHRLVRGRRLVLGGVTIPSEFGLDGHSDADAAVHALIDALLGAAGLPDIGARFPNNDPRWKGADSVELLRDVVQDLNSRGWNVGNVDITVSCEAPKLAPHISAMKERLAPVLGIENDACGIKAGTFERLGFVGRSEGILASAVALIQRA
jgi:2-C-methyl-D-erythritol 2,4-cyclodiphosphate synthase